MRKRKIWQLQKCDREYAAGIAADLGVSPVVVSVLLNRGVREKEEIREFLFGSEQPFHEPLLMKDMQKAAERILEAVKNGEQITVYGDYDVDGISASSLLYLYLQGLGAKVNTYIPKRKNEGYGLNNEALAALAEAGTTLLVTVDCGISGVGTGMILPPFFYFFQVWPRAAAGFILTAKNAKVKLQRPCACGRMLGKNSDTREAAP